MTNFSGENLNAACGGMDSRRNGVAEVSPKYLSDIATNGVPVGYKQTEVGVIPEDWDVKKIGDLANVIRGASPRPKGDKRYYGGIVPRLMVEDVTRDGKYVTPVVDSLTEAGAKLSRPCPAGTLTIVCSGTVGIPSILAVDACIHDGFLGLNKVSKKVRVDYLFHFFTTQREKFNNSATHGGVFTNLTTDGVREFLVALPSNIEEQTAIANALSDVDALISELEKLIAKKQAIKTATMQQLLTGRTRLPQFALRQDGTPKGTKPSELGEIPEDWEVHSLSSICDVRDGTHDSPKYKDNGIPLVTSKNIVDDILDLSNVSLISPEDAFEIDKRSKVDKGDIIMSMIGTVGSAVLLLEEPKFCIKNVALFKPKKVSGEFLVQLIRSKIFQDYLEDSMDGGIQKFVSLGTLRNMEISLPSEQEQTAIATILSDMDAEIQALEQRLGKTRQIKQGMMQELLTGKTRLIKPSKEVIHE